MRKVWSFAFDMHISIACTSGQVLSPAPMGNASPPLFDVLMAGKLNHNRAMVAHNSQDWKQQPEKYNCSVSMYYCLWLW